MNASQSLVGMGLVVGIALASAAHAQDRTWNLNADGDWNDSANWDPNDVPDTDAENAIVTSPDETTAVTVSISPNTTREVGDLTILDNGPNPDHTVVLPNNTFLDVHGDILNDGVIELNSTGNFTRLRLDGSDLSLDGAGLINLGAGAFNAISGTSGTHTLTNSATHTIAGGGRLGDNSINVVNAGTVDANLLGVLMTIDPNSALGFTNTGTVRGSSGGLVLLTGNAGGAFDNTGGVIEATGAGSEVQLTASAGVTGGTVRGAGGGLVRANASQNVFFTDVTFEGAIQSDNNTDFGVSGTITNNGAIAIAATVNATDVEVQAGGATFAGSGTLTLDTSSSGIARINGISNPVLTNGVSHTIQGRGNVGVNAIGVVNNGLVDANVSGQTLTIDPNAASGFDNDATVRATGGGIALLTGSGGGDFDNAGGVIEAIDAGSEAQLTAGASVSGGTVRGTGGGLVRALAGQNVFFTDVTFEGAVRVDNNTDFGLSGVITNNAAITIESTGNSTDIELQADTTLQGGGTITLQGPIARVNSAGGPHTLTNNGNTIAGSGSLDTPVVNNGAIAGTSDTEFIEINSLLTGGGSLANVRIDNVHAPGDDVASVSLSGDYTIASSGELHLDIGGTTPGTGYDQLSVTGDITVDGDLIVSPIDLTNGYVPAPGDVFTIIDSATPISGAFDSISLPPIFGNRVLTWEPVDFSDPTRVVLEIATTALLGDADGDGDVDGDDLIAVQTSFGSTMPPPGDADGDGDVDGDDLIAVQTNFGDVFAVAVPEPTSLALLALAALGRRRRREFSRRS